MNRNVQYRRLAGVAIGAALLVPVLSSASTVTHPPGRAAADVDALLKHGPRVAGTEGANLAAAYLEEQFRASGYDVRVEPFTYDRTRDLGSDVRVGERTVRGYALQGSPSGELSASLVAVPGVGTPEEFAGADVRGKVAVVSRGQLTFLAKAQNAAAAGAVGLVIVNNAPGSLRGTLGQGATIPVLGVAQDEGSALLGGAGGQGALRVRIQQEVVQGRNVVAFTPGVTAPKVLLGGHYDSVTGAPGANDNASGTATVLEIARRAAGTDLGRNAYFVAFDGEEDGLHGSRAFVKSNPELVQGLRGMLNFDMVGVNVTPLSVGGTDAALNLATTTFPTLQRMAGGKGGSDHAPFADAGVEVLFFHRGLDANYHQPGDTVYDSALLDETVEAGQRVAEAMLQQR